MIDSYYHVSINGVKYRLAEGGEGSHYRLRSEELRPPNASVVQGEDSQKFQIRPDVLQWNLTDWSGGEGQFVFDPQQPNRWYILDNVRAFEQPGRLMTGWYMRLVDDAVATSNESYQAVWVSGGTAYFIESGSASGTEQFITVNMITGVSTDIGAFTGRTGTGAIRHVFSDGRHAYFGEADSNDLYKVALGATAVSVLNGTDLSVGGDWNIGYPGQGEFLYLFDRDDGILYQIDRVSGTATVIQDSFDITGNHEYNVIGGEGFAYFAHHDPNLGTFIYKIVPDNAAGVGFLEPVANLPVRANSNEVLWNHPDNYALWINGGILFIAATSMDAASTFSEPTVYYIQLDGSMGTLGRLRAQEEYATPLVAATQPQSLLTSYFMTGRSHAELHVQLWEVDAVSGGMAIVARGDENSIGSGGAPWSFVVGGVGAAISGFSEFAIANSDQYAENGVAISPWHDFDLVGEKILGSIHLSTEALPADWTVYVDYATDGGTTFTNVLTQSTDNSTLTEVQVSTPASPVLFTQVQIQIRMEYTGSGIPSSSPIIRGVEVHAAVSSEQRLWDLLLSMDDDNESENPLGTEKIANLATARATGAPVVFLDGYKDRNAGVYETVDATVAEYQLILSKPGEGVAAVTMREVV